MKVYLVTSSVTFVPDNYNLFILKMAESPHIQGLIVLENRNLPILIQALKLYVTRIAPRLGKTLLRNYFFPGLDLRKREFLGRTKDFVVFRDINEKSCLEYVQSKNVDLLVNSRTRYIFKKEILQTPKLGCLNLHHGLLPRQRGLMNDFWSHLENEPFGFSIHQMTDRIDDGKILRTQEVQTNRNSYLESIKESSKLEALALSQVLDQIARTGKIEGIENHSTEIRYRKNPHWTDVLKLKKKGIQI